MITFINLYNLCIHTRIKINRFPVFSNCTIVLCSWSITQSLMKATYDYIAPIYSYSK